MARVDRLSEKQSAVYMRHIVKGFEPDACWGWTGPVTSDGYPRVRDHIHRELSAQQASWLLSHPGEPLPPAVKTTCRHRLCTNPKHLRAARHRGMRPVFFNREPYPDRLTQEALSFNKDLDGAK